MASLSAVPMARTSCPRDATAPHRSMNTCSPPPRRRASMIWAIRIALAPRVSAVASGRRGREREQKSDRDDQSQPPILPKAEGHASNGQGRDEERLGQSAHAACHGVETHCYQTQQARATTAPTAPSSSMICRGRAMGVQRHQVAACVADIRVQRVDVARSVEPPPQQWFLGNALDREVPNFHAMLGRCHQPVGPLPPLAVHFFRGERHADENQDACGNRNRESRLAMRETNNTETTPATKPSVAAALSRKNEAIPSRTGTASTFQPRPLDQR